MQCDTSAMPKSMPAPSRGEPSAAVERATAIALRTVHLVAVVALGAALLGAPRVSAALAGATMVASGVLLLALDLRARRLVLREAAGLVVLVKVVATAWIAVDGAGASVLFWVLVVLSSLSSHAPKGVRHWRPGR